MSGSKTIMSRSLNRLLSGRDSAYGAKPLLEGEFIGRCFRVTNIKLINAPITVIKLSKRWICHSRCILSTVWSTRVISSPKDAESVPLPFRKSFSTLDMHAHTPCSPINVYPNARMLRTNTMEKTGRIKGLKRSRATKQVQRPVQGNNTKMVSPLPSLLFKHLTRREVSRKPVWRGGAAASSRAFDF
jgi:hypothetical protein